MGIEFPLKVLKAKIHVKGKATSHYVVDDMVVAAGTCTPTRSLENMIHVFYSNYPCFLVGHEVGQLPGEWIQAQVKGHVKSSTKAFNLSEVEQLAWEGLEKGTGNCWAKMIKQVREKMEDD